MKYASLEQLLKVVATIGWSYERLGPNHYKLFTSDASHKVCVEDLPEFLARYCPKDRVGWEELFQKFPEEPIDFFETITSAHPLFIKGVAHGLGLDRFSMHIKRKHRLGQIERVKVECYRQYKEGTPVPDIAKAVGVSISSVYLAIRREKNHELRTHARKNC